MTPGSYRIKAEVGGFDLDVVDCQSQDGGRRTDVGPDPASPCQKWRISSVDGGVYKIIGTGSGKSLDVAGCSPNRGADVIIWPFHGGSCQRWYFSPP